jgi:hypothetical protein
LRLALHVAPSPPAPLPAWERGAGTSFLPFYVASDFQFNFSRDVENLSPNLSPTLERGFEFSPFLLGKGAGGLGLGLVFPHDVKSQISNLWAICFVPASKVVACWKNLLKEKFLCPL